MRCTLNASFPKWAVLCALCIQQPVHRMQCSRVTMHTGQRWHTNTNNNECMWREDKTSWMSFVPYNYKIQQSKWQLSHEWFDAMSSAEELAHLHIWTTEKKKRFSRRSTLDIVHSFKNKTMHSHEEKRKEQSMQFMTLQGITTALERQPSSPNGFAIWRNWNTTKEAMRPIIHIYISMTRARARIFFLTHRGGACGLVVYYYYSTCALIMCSLPLPCAIAVEKGILITLIIHRLFGLLLNASSLIIFFFTVRSWSSSLFSLAHALLYRFLNTHLCRYDNR